jgi:hypothetical protein
MTQIPLQLLRQSNSLRPLSAVHHDKLDLNKNFPSWVPALHEESLAAPLGIDKRLYYTAGSAVADAKMFWSNSDGVLTVRGLVFDTLSSSSSPSFPEGGAAIEAETMHAFRDAFTLSQSQAQVAYEASKRPEAFGLTMTAGLVEHDPAEDKIAQHRANFLAYLVKVLNLQRNTRRKHALGRDKSLIAQIRDEAINGDDYYFTRDANVTWSGRKFFCTSRGFIGFGPKVLRNNDLCCVLFGARVPFILRETQNHYLLVGECYLHGIMRGEAIDMWRNGDLQVQEFELH